MKQKRPFNPDRPRQETPAEVTLIVAVYWFNDVVDGGPIAAQAFCHIRREDTAAELWGRELAPMGLRLFGRVFDQLDAGKIVAVAQDKALATWEPAIGAAPPLWRPDVLRLGCSRWERVEENA